VCPTVPHMTLTSDTLEAMKTARLETPRTVRRLIRHFDISVVEVARTLGIDRTGVYARFAGSTAIKSEELAGLSAMLNVPVGVFYTSADDALRWVLAHPEAGPNRALKPS
jgi:hypothetical protein